MDSRGYTENSKCTLFIILAIAAIMTTMPVVTNVITDAIKVEAQSHGIDASSVYETKSMDLGNDIKNLVILIPNEGHESQNIGDQRYRPTARQSTIYSTKCDSASRNCYHMV